MSRTCEQPFGLLAQRYVQSFSRNGSDAIVFPKTRKIYAFVLLPCPIVLGLPLRHRFYLIKH
jgi:hypothetical protein